MQVNNAAEYAGTFMAPDGKALRFAADGKRLALVMGDRTIPLQRAGNDSFVSTVPGAMAAYAISFGRAGEEKNPGPVVDVSYGPEWFAGEKYTGAKSFQVPEAYALFAGHYRSDSPWGGDSRVYVLKHMTRSTAAEIDRPLELNQIGQVIVTASRPLVFDPYVDNRFTGCFIVIDPATNFTSGAGMIERAIHDAGPSASHSTVAERLAQVARAAGSEREAVEAVRAALEEILK